MKWEKLDIGKEQARTDRGFYVLYAAWLDGHPYARLTWYPEEPGKTRNPGVEIFLTRGGGMDAWEEARAKAEVHYKKIGEKV